MELKPYQQQVLDDLTLYLDKVQETKDIQTAFSQFWYTHPRTPLVPTLTTVIEPYKNNVKGVPHVCVKVPTAGGKTFIASNALKNIFDAYDTTNTRAVVWLVPSITILEQTLRNLQDPYHPYRQKINTYFRNRVEVYDKNALLNGSNFNASTVKENLSIFILSFDSLRAKKKEDRKVYQENGNLQSFEHELSSDEEITLINIIRSFNPVVVVDESHNAETDLSVEMLQNLNPSFILDLTATPRNNSNIISFVDAFELKKENMVKLPVIVYNQHDKTEVIASAIKMQRKLEQEAKAEQKAGGKYIRPIVLLQAQPKSKEDNTTFEKIKEILIKSRIPKEQIKIKTATTNEIKGIDLMSKDCEVRYIITINALKEGWDCPFAYVLASLADKSSSVDVEQILGRILRQPYVTKHSSELLNMSYVLTASSKFQDTLKNIVKGLNKAGFSSKDYKVADAIPTDGNEPDNKTNEPQPLSSLFGNPSETPEKESNNLENINIDILTDVVSGKSDSDEADTAIVTITQTARNENANMENALTDLSKGSQTPIPTELSSLVKTITIKEIFAEQAKTIHIPQFYMMGQTSTIFGNEDIPVDRDGLLAGFPLDKASIDIDFSAASSEMYQVDLDSTKKDSTPTYLKIDGKDKEILSAYLSAPTTTTKGKIKTLSANIKKNIGLMSPISDKMINDYLKRILETFDNDQYFSFIDNLYSHSQQIKKKINEEANIYIHKQFRKLLDTDKIELKSTYTFPTTINPVDTIDFLPKSLYEKEGKMNKFEQGVINDVGNMPNILFWTRNIERRGFKINGFINHYPDFIIVTKLGNVVLLETKGDHLEAIDKIELGNTWANKAGKGFKYYLVYDERNVEGADRKNDFLEIMKEL